MGFPITQRPITGNITASGQTFVVPCLQANFALVQMVATSLSGHVCSIEGSIDSTTGADGNWFSISASRSNAPGTIEQATGTLAATPAYFWRINCAGMKYIRFRSTGHTAGTAAYTAFTLEDEIDAVIGGIVSLATGGSVALAAGTNLVGSVSNADNIYWNESVTAQAAAATVTGTARETGVAVATAQRYAAFNAFAFADQAGTLRIEISTDNVTWRRASADVAVAANTPVHLSVPVTARHYRAVYVNGATLQGAFMLNTSFTVS
jgi:hypothetical protein